MTFEDARILAVSRFRVPVAVIFALAAGFVAAGFLCPLPARSELPIFTAVPGTGITWLPGDLGVEEHTPLVSGIIGYMFLPTLAIEGRGALLHADSDTLDNPRLEIVHLEFNLTWFLNEDATITPYLTAGMGGVRMHATNALAFNGGAGALYRFSDNIGLRLDARDQAFRLPTFESSKFHHTPELFVGVSFGFGAGKDDDGDGIGNRHDRCPGTPAGALVDEQGCPMDSDRDGVPDGIDDCMTTPSGVKVDARGCPIDSDGDAVFDGLDQCPDTPRGASVDDAGCPMDTDKDGIFDGLDRCEMTIPGCRVDSVGCEFDADQDGVCDGLDKCPNTPRSSRVDMHGCPTVVNERETELLETGMIRLQEVKFEPGKASITPDSYRALNDVGEILLRWPALRIEISGHTDSRGDNATNQKLSEARARAVLVYLVEKFPALSAGQFTTVGYGETKPLADNASEVSRARNRRVEFKVLNREALKRDTSKPKAPPKE